MSAEDASASADADAGAGTGADAQADTRADGYTQRLAQREGVWWKRLLNVQAPYRWKLRRLLGERAVLDVGCGIGRNLVSLGPGSVGVDHNEHSVAHCRERGLVACTVDEFWRSPYGKPGSFDGLLAAHLVEHLDERTALEVVGSYLPCLRPGSVVVVITPQERGYASDATHVRFCGFAEVADLCRELGLRVEAQSSFPFPRWAGKWFTYNEFVTVARTS